VAEAGGRTRCRFAGLPVDKAVRPQGRQFMPNGGSTMRLNSPSLVLFLIALVLAAMALVTKLGFIPVPRYIPHQDFWLAITAYLTLMFGNLVRGL
jgi:hypothetical protein